MTLLRSKKQIFRLADDLDMLSSAYDSLQVITGSSPVDASHVSFVLYSLNYRFAALTADLYKLHGVDQS